MHYSVKSKATLALVGLVAALLLVVMACGSSDPIIVEKEVVKEVPVEVVVIQEVVKEVPVEVVVEKEVVRIVEQQVVVVVEVTPAPAPLKTELFVLSNDSPHISVIDTETNKVVRTADLPYFTSWTWNDDNNYFDGTNLWLGMKDAETTEVEVIALNLDTLEVTARFPIGKESKTLYIGQATRNGVLLIGKMGSGQVVAIDTKARRLLSTWDVPVNGGVVCDADIAIGPDGVERYFYPTQVGDTLVSINVETGETLKVVSTPDGFKPHMMTIAPNGTVWVQEAGSNANSVFDPVTLELINRFPTGAVPVVNTFSPDGKYSYIGHAGDTTVLVVDTETYEEVASIAVGTNPRKIAVNPNGKYIYATQSKEGMVAVIDTSTWEVTERITLGTNPNGIFLRAGS